MSAEEVDRAILNEAVSAGLSIRKAKEQGYLTGMDSSTRDRMLMAEHITETREVAHRISSALRKARQVVDATASPQHAAWAEELDAAIAALALA